MRYPAYKQELFAIFSAVQHLKEHLVAKHFTILSDARSLTYHLSLDTQPDLVDR